MNKASTIEGQCHCGKIKVRVGLSEPAANYNPRACDCSFCQKHGAAYLSDAKGVAAITLDEDDALKRYKQGSNSADMLICDSCGVLIGAGYEDGEKHFGAFNVRIFPETFGEPIVVSPQKLDAAEKVERWKAVWFGDVKIGMTG